MANLKLNKCGHCKEKNLETEAERPFTLEDKCIVFGISHNICDTCLKKYYEKINGKWRLK